MLHNKAVAPNRSVGEIFLGHCHSYCAHEQFPASGPVHRSWLRCTPIRGSRVLTPVKLEWRQAHVSDTAYVVFVPFAPPLKSVRGMLMGVLCSSGSKAYGIEVAPPAPAPRGPSLAEPPTLCVCGGGAAILGRRVPEGRGQFIVAGTATNTYGGY